MALYNISKLTDSANVGGIATASNSYSDGILFGMGSLVFYFIMLLALKRNSDFDEALFVASFLSFIIAGIFTYGKYLNIIFPLAYLVITAFTGLYMWTSKNSPY